MNELIKYTRTNNLVDDVCCIIDDAQIVAISSVNSALVLRNWLLGKRIKQECMSGSRSERYGSRIIADLAERLTKIYGKGFDKRSLYRYVQFCSEYPRDCGVSVPAIWLRREPKECGVSVPAFYTEKNIDLVPL